MKKTKSLLLWSLRQQRKTIYATMSAKCASAWFCLFHCNWKNVFLFLLKLAYQLRFSFRYKIAFSAIQKLKLFSLLKIKEGLKTATEIELLFLMASFFQNSLINCDFSLRYKIAFSAIPEFDNSLIAEN